MPENPQPTPPNPQPPAPPQPPGPQPIPPNPTPLPHAEDRPVTLPGTEWGAINRELMELRSYRAGIAEKERADEAARIQALAAKTQMEKEFEQYRASEEAQKTALRAEADRIKTEWLAQAKAAAIGDALAGLEFNGADPNVTARHVRRLIEEEVEAVLDRDGRPTVRDKATLAEAAKYLRERLAGPDFALYLKPRGQGGSGMDGTRSGLPAQPPTGPAAALAASVASYHASNAGGVGLRPLVH